MNRMKAVSNGKDAFGIFHSEFYIIQCTVLTTMVSDSHNQSNN